jgi:transcriptional regulator GlxA family with amidase domain
VKKEEIIAAIRKCAQELGRTPSLGELTERVHVSTRTVTVKFLLAAIGAELACDGFTARRAG